MSHEWRVASSRAGDAGHGGRDNRHGSRGAATRTESHSLTVEQRRYRDAWANTFPYPYGVPYFLALAFAAAIEERGTYRADDSAAADAEPDSGATDTSTDS